MAHMDIYITAKGACYSAQCKKCGASMLTHEWAHQDHNERRDAMEAGTLRCDECCIGTADATTFFKMRDSYAGRWSADGYLDCTEWQTDTNKARLISSLKQQ